MKDKGHKYADKELNKLIKRIVKEYNTAYRGIKRKADEYFKEFEAEDTRMFYKVDKGIISRDEYLQWRKVELAQGQKWNDTIKAIAKDYADITRIASDMTSEEMNYVYANNFNYGTYTIESAGGINTNFTLYNKDTVKELLVKNPQLLPKPDPTKVIRKAERWNMRKVNSALLQGILQGDSIEKISKRLREVTNMNISSSIRNARTMTTRAESSGRLHAFQRASEMGIDVKKMWIATIDGRTRHSHRILDKEVVNIDEEFSNGLSFPGDPDGAPSEVYNCRCAMVAIPYGLSEDIYTNNRVSKYLDNLDISYDEWKEGKR